MAVSVWKGMSPWVRLYRRTPRLQEVPGRGRYNLFFDDDDDDDDHDDHDDHDDYDDHDNYDDHDDHDDDDDDDDDDNHLCPTHSGGE